MENVIVGSYLFVGAIINYRAFKKNENLGWAISFIVLLGMTLLLTLL